MARIRFSYSRNSSRHRISEFMFRVKTRGVTIVPANPNTHTTSFIIRYEWTVKLVNEALGLIAATLKSTRNYDRDISRLVVNPESIDDTIAAIENEISLHGVNYPTPDFTLTSPSAPYALMRWMLVTCGDEELRRHITSSNVYRKFTDRFDPKLFVKKACTEPKSVP